MSTREFQAHDDALKRYNELGDWLKTTRMEFVKLIRTTGVRIRKELINSDSNIIAINCTLHDARAVEVAMCVDVTTKGAATDVEIVAVKDWLHKHGWRINEETFYHRQAGRFCLTCI